MPDISRRRLLQGAGTAAAAAFAAEFLPSNVRKALAAGPSRGGSIRDIKHVVILMQENRSFDHYFGTLPNVRGFSDPNAITLSSGQKVWYQPDTLQPGRVPAAVAHRHHEHQRAVACRRPATPGTCSTIRGTAA